MNVTSKGDEMDKQGSWYIVKGDSLLGVVVKYPKGYLFLSRTTGQSNGRKYHSCPVDAIPEWAYKASDDFLTSTEFARWRRHHLLVLQHLTA